MTGCMFPSHWCPCNATFLWPDGKPHAACFAISSTLLMPRASLLQCTLKGQSLRSGKGPSPSRANPTMLLLMVLLPAAPCIHQGEAPFISCCFIPLCSEGKSIWHSSRYTALTFLLLLPATRVKGLLRRRDATGTGLVSFTHLLSQAKTETGSPLRLHFTTTGTTL